MAQPSAYNRAFNFSNYQAEHPTSPLPAASIDLEFSRIKQVLDQIRQNLALIQRDDTALANRSVGFDQLKTEIEIGVNPPSTWATETNYVERDSVFHEQKFYTCLESHVSGTFADDLAAEKWELVADFTAAQAASLVTYDNSTSGLTAENMQDAMDELVASVAVTSVFGRSGAVTAAASDYDADQVDFDASGLSHTDATDVQEAIADLDTAVTEAASSVPTGTVLDFAGTSAPSGYLMCYGQTVSRATYAALFAVIGTTFGAGDGSTTFALPDARGRVAAGKDNMGGASAGRITGAGAGFAGGTLGATGGSQTHTLTTAEMPPHDHDVGVSVSGTASTRKRAEYATDVGGSRVAGVNGTAVSGSEADPTGLSLTVSVSETPKGGGGAHNNVQPTIIFNKIIKT